MRLSRAALIAVMVLLPWSGVTALGWFHPRAALVDVAAALAVGAWVLATARRDPWPRLRPLHGLVALYLAWSAVSLVAHGVSAQASAQVAGTAVWVLMAQVTSAHAREPGTLRRLTCAAEWLTALVAGAAALGVLLSALGLETPLVGTHGDLLPGPYARAQAGMPHPNLLGSYCLFLLAPLGGEHSRLRPGMRRVLLALIGATLLLALSRALLAVPVALAIAQATTPRRRRLAAAIAALAAGAYLTLTLVPLELDPTRPAVARVAGRPGPRLTAARTALGTLLEHPWVGSGPGTPPGLVDGWPFKAHLTPLNVAATLGLPALAALTGIGVTLVRQRRRPTDLALWGALAAVALDGLAQDIEHFRHLWILVGLADAQRQDGRPVELSSPDA